MRGIKKLDIFMVRQFLLLFIGTFCISLFVLMMQFLWRYVDELIGKGLSLEVLGKFFWYMGLMLVPQALPLAVLLSSLITMGNLGESSELTAIKAAGISLLKSLRGLIVFVVLIATVSFIFQNDIGPQSNVNLRQLLLSMKQKSPELEIPEEIFYSGIPNCNLYVQKKDLETGMLYGIMIYRMTQSFEDAAIILADSGKLQSTAEKQHLLLTLYNGEWFENMRSQELAGNANVPYRRESFSEKQIVLDFDNGFNLAEASGISQSATAQSIKQLLHHIDSLKLYQDSVGKEVRRELRTMAFNTPQVNKADSIAAIRYEEKGKASVDSLYQKMSPEKQLNLMQQLRSRVNNANVQTEFRSFAAEVNFKMVREDWIELVNKFTLSFMVIVFFFIGASLGAIIRKGGLGVPVIISVIVFILFYILDNTGFRMARQASWSIAFGKGLAPAVLVPLATWVTYKANKDSVVFNMDAYRMFFIRVLGLRIKRHITSKEVIIHDPNYFDDVRKLSLLTDSVRRYSRKYKLKYLFNAIIASIRYKPDPELDSIIADLEAIVDDLSNTRDRFILSYLNKYPIIAEKGLGRLRLYRELKQIRKVNDLMITRIEQLTKNI
ncbi:MAG: LptF/LptG family permease [Bacteroidaceae bacterium]|nr:LptF/LptG family permease [Bacteroidaceae bacterium]